MRDRTNKDRVKAARELPADELKKLLDEKTQPSPEVDLVATLLAEAEKLPGEELAKFVQSHEKGLRALHILYMKRALKQVNLGAAELDGMLTVLDKLDPATKSDLTTRIQQAAVASGLEAGQALQQFAQKLTRMGLHL